MKTLTDVNDIQIGSLLHRADGRSFFIIYQDDENWGYYSLNTYGNFYVSTMKVQTEIFNDDFEYSIDGVFNDVPVENLLNVLSERKRTRENVEALLEPVAPINTLLLRENEQKGVKALFVPGTVFLDRYRKLHHVCYVDNNMLYTLPLTYGTEYQQHKPIDLNDLSKRLKHRHARCGIQIVTQQPAATYKLLGDSQYGNISNYMINAASQWLCLDFRTTKDLGGKKRPHYTHDLWQIDPVNETPLWGQLSKGAHRLHMTSPTQSELNEIDRMSRKFPQIFAQKTLEPELLKIYIFAASRKKTSAGHLKETFNIPLEEGNRLLKALCKLRYLKPGQQKANSFVALRY